MTCRSNRYGPAQLHRNFGKLHMAQNHLDEALEDLSKDIYCSSLEVGPEHIDTSAGYFLIANIFYAQRKVSRVPNAGDRVLVPSTGAEVLLGWTLLASTITTSSTGEAPSAS